MILTRKRDLNNVKNTRRMHSADYDTDNNLVCSMIHLIPCKMHNTKSKSLPRINAICASIRSTYQRLCDTLRKSLGKTRGDPTTGETKWKEIRTALY
jgi:hypothetical protein